MPISEGGTEMGDSWVSFCVEMLVAGATVPCLEGVEGPVEREVASVFLARCRRKNWSFRPFFGRFRS